MSDEATGPVEKAPPAFTSLGATGLKRYGEWVYEEYLPQLQGQKAITVYREMADNDAIIGAVLFAIKMLMRKVDWHVRPSSQSEVALDQADFVEECMGDMEHTWPDFISEVMSMMQFGWSYFDVVYKRRGGPTKKAKKFRSRYDDNKIGWRKFSIRSQDSLNGWQFDDDGDVSGMRQLAPPDFQDVVIPREKALHFVTESIKNNPEGRSILRNAYRPWFFKKRLEEVEAIGMERDLAGLPVMKVPAHILDPTNTNPADIAMREAVFRLVQNIRRDQQEGIVIPQTYDRETKMPLYELELLSTGGSRQLDINESIVRYDQRIAMTVLADFILLGTQNVGSWALSNDKSNLFGLAISAWLDSIAERLNKEAIPRLLELNNMDLTEMPYFEHADVQGPDLAEFGEFISKLAGAGMPLFPDPDLEAHLRQVADLPEKSEEAEALQLEKESLALDQQRVAIEAQQTGALSTAMDAEIKPRTHVMQREGQEHNQKLVERQQEHTESSADRTMTLQERIAASASAGEDKKKKDEKDKKKSKKA